MTEKRTTIVQRLKQCEGCRRRRERLSRMLRRAQEASRKLAEAAGRKYQESRQ